MSRIYKHSHNPSYITMDNINRIVDIIETYLCDYKLGFHLVYQRSHLIRMDICKLNSKSVIASYSFRYNTMTLFKRKVLQGVVSLEDMIKENERRGYEYLQWFNTCKLVYLCSIICISNLSTMQRLFLIFYGVKQINKFHYNDDYNVSYVVCINKYEIWWINGGVQCKMLKCYDFTKKR